MVTIKITQDQLLGIINGDMDELLRLQQLYLANTKLSVASTQTQDGQFMVKFQAVPPRMEVVDEVTG